MPEPGKCQCGCGRDTNIARQNRGEAVAGQPLRYIRGHRRSRNGRVSDRDGYQLIRHGDGYVPEHVLIASRALGKPLPSRAVVHHVDGNTSDNRPSNLVVCQDQAYHRLLHRRQDALDACGRADWLKCPICKSYDAPENLYVTTNRGRTSGRHRACHAAAELKRRHVA